MNYGKNTYTPISDAAHFFSQKQGFIRREGSPSSKHAYEQSKDGKKGKLLSMEVH